MTPEARLALAVACSHLLCPPGGVAGQAGGQLGAGSREEWAVEKLVGFGLIDDRIAGLRPWSHAEALRLAAQARDNLARVGGEERAAAERLLAVVGEGRLGESVRAEVGAHALLLDSPWRVVPSAAGADEIDAGVNHLVRYRGGRDFADGATVGSEATASAVLGRHLSVQVRPRAWVERDETGRTDWRARLLEARGRLHLGRLRIDVGRHGSVWGPGRDGGTLLATEARGLDRVAAASDAPFRWPGFLSRLGPSRAELFWARLEGDRDVPHARLVGYKVSVRPHPLVEGSFSALIQSGGEGAPDASLGALVADHLLFVDWLLDGEHTFRFSNKALSLGARVRIPSLRHGQLFAEYTVEDPGRSLKRQLWQDAGWLVGVWIPRVDRTGVLDLRVELHHGGVRLHQHGQFTSGRTLDGRILGMGGPDTNAGFVELTADDGGRRLSIELGVEDRSADRWRVRLREGGGIDVWEKAEDLPDELRLRALVKLTSFGRGGREIGIGLGFERVSDHGFQKSVLRHNALVEVAVRAPLLIGG